MGIKERWRRTRPLPDDVESMIRGLQRLFEQKGVLLAYLFGSFARGERGEDLDLAVLPGRDNFPEIWEAVLDYLGSERFDLVNLRSAPLWLQFEIIRTGKVIYRKSVDVENDYELRVVKMYQDREPVRRRQHEIFGERLRTRWS
ncbi:MAG TPA: nucleotidyltransferase domain-containing protein [Desulfobacterales bacterium]|nr:nucleotidyltransferase domain-containing protein [Desulfobacterales bacterium]